jgi:DNA-binding NarL/FixJ family response regulator
VSLVKESARLSPRQSEVLALVAGGLRSPEIARELGISRTTVETHTGAAMRKLGTRSRIQAAALVVRPANGGRPAAALTEEQRLVLELVREGRTQREIAAFLGISRRTLDRRLAAARAALDAATTAEAVLAGEPPSAGYRLARIEDATRERAP